MIRGRKKGITKRNSEGVFVRSDFGEDVALPGTERRASMLTRSFRFLNKWSIQGIAVIFVGAGVFYTQGVASIERLYPTTCLGGWENVEQATGEQSVNDRFDASEFDGTNSALMNGLEQIFCGHFTGDLVDEQHIQKASLHFSLAVRSQEDVLTQAPSLRNLFSLRRIVGAQSATQTETTQTENTVDDSPVVIPAEANSNTDVVDTVQAIEDTPTTNDTDEVNANSDELIVEVVGSEDGGQTFEPVEVIDEIEDGMDDEEVVDPDAPIVEVVESSDDGETWNSVDPDDIFEVFYTLDGEDWLSLGRVGFDNWENVEYEIPLSGWADTKQFQVRLQGVNASLEDTYVYLDAMWLKIDYEDVEDIDETVELDENSIAQLPKEKIENNGRYLEPLQDEFDIDEAPEFEFNVSDFNNNFDRFPDELFTEEGAAASVNIANDEAVTDDEQEPSDDQLIEVIKTEDDGETFESVDVVDEPSTTTDSEVDILPQASGSEPEDPPDENTVNDTDSTEDTPNEQENTSSEDTLDQSVSFLNNVRDTFFSLTTPQVAYAQEVESNPVEVDDGSDASEELVEENVEDDSESVEDASEENDVDESLSVEDETEDVDESANDDSGKSAEEIKEAQRVTPVTGVQPINKQTKPTGPPTLKKDLDRATKKIVEDSINEPQVVASRVRDSRGQEMKSRPVVVTEEGKVKVRVPKQPDTIRPGKYTIELDVMKNGVVYTMTQDFMWGVLALNMDKTIYEEGDIAYFQMAALNSGGYTLCEAPLKLRLRKPSGENVQFSTEDGTILYSGDCGEDNVTYSPDYFVRYRLDEDGIYQVVLLNEDTGYRIKDTFRVDASETFIVYRESATRINPFKADYDMTFNVEAQVDFKGYITESVPEVFEIIDEGGAQIINADGKQYLRWKVDIAAGEGQEFVYTYSAPRVSPQFYKLGPIIIDEKPAGILAALQAEEEIFRESRQWQIASDAPPGAGDGTTIGLVSDGDDDSGTNEHQAMTDDLDHLISELPSGWALDAVAWQGDIAYDNSSIATAITAHASSTASSSPLFFTVGNHDAETAADMVALRAHYSNYESTYDLMPATSISVASTTNYSFQIGDVHVAVVNQYATSSDDSSGVGFISDDVFDWLKQDLKTATTTHIIVTGHEPAYPKARHVGDSLDQNPTNRDKFINLLASYGVVAHAVGHTHNSALYEMTFDEDLGVASALGGGIWELDTGAFGTKASGGADDAFPSLGYFHASSSVWGDYQLYLVQGSGTPAWNNPIISTSTHADLSKQILVNTWTDAGTGSTSRPHYDTRYWIDYDATVEANPDWSSNNSGRWWQPAFNDVTAGWTDGELAIGYDDNAAAWGWLNHQFDPDPNSSGGEHVYGYFARVTFPATNTTGYGNLDLDVDYEDGVIVWLNGVEVWRTSDNSITTPTTGSGAEYFDQCAIGAAVTNNAGKETATPSFTTIDISEHLGDLVNGTNTLAIMVSNGHSSSCATAVSSSDLAFGARLTMYGEPPEPETDVDQEHYRWRNDDNDEENATWWEAEDTSTSSVLLGTKKRLRLGIANNGTESSVNRQYSLQWSTSSNATSGTWYYIQPYASSTCDATQAFCMELSNLVQGDPTTNVASGLTDGATTFVAGEQLETNATTSNITLDEDEFTEIEWVVKVMGHAATSTTYYFRAVRDGIALDSYSVLPSITTTDSGNGGGGGSATLEDDATNSHTYNSPSTSISASLGGATAGNLLVAALAVDKNSGTITVPSGFTLINDYQSSSVSGAMAYKVATGGETTIQWSYANNEEASMWVGEFSGMETSSVLDQSVENDSGGSAVGSISSGTTGATTQDNEIAIAMMAADSGNNTETGRAWTNGFNIQAHAWTNSGTPALNVATKTLSTTGAVETTFSTTDGTDQMYAGVATFKISGGGTDTTAPRVTDVSTNKEDGTYGNGESIDIDVTFSEPVTSSGSVTVYLDNGNGGGTCTFTVTNSAFGTCNYIVQGGDNISDLSFSYATGTIVDAADNALVGTAPLYDNIDDFHDIELSTVESTFEQGSFRWMSNGQDHTPSSTIAAQNATATLSINAQEFRLRQLVNIGSTSLPTSSISFKLQFVDPGTGSCAAPTGGTPAVYTDVTASTDIAYFDNSLIADGATTTSYIADPDDGNTVRTQTYEELNNTRSNIRAIGVGEDGLWDFSLYDNAAPFDSTYCFRMVLASGLTFATYTEYAVLTTAGSPNSISQGSYRWFENDNSTDVGDPLAVENGTTTLEFTGSEFRLRQLLNIASSVVATSGRQFKLQFVDKGAGTCASPSGGSPSSYTNVTANTFIAFNDNASPDDDDALTPNANDPDDSNTIRYQAYEELNDATNSVAAIGIGEDAMWDFSLIDNGASPDTTYCLRMADIDGNALSGTYNEYPEITTAATSTVTQGSYRLYETADDVVPSTPLAAQNATGTLTSNDQTFRLRQLINVAGSAMATSTGVFKLQFVDPGTGTCAAPVDGSPSSYTDVTGSTFIAFGGLGTTTDNQAATSTVNDPDDSNTIRYQAIEENNPATNTHATIGVGEDGLWDFILQENDTPINQEYCLRVIYNDDSALDSYTTYPVIISSQTLAGDGTTIGLVADGDDTGGTNQSTAMTADLNQLVPQLPSGWGLDTIIWAGDMAYSGSDMPTAVEAWENSTASSAPMFFVVGNHDAETTADMVFLRDYFSQYPDYNLQRADELPHASTTNYSYEIGDVYVAVINHYMSDSNDFSASGFVNEGAFAWLKQSIKGTTKTHKIVSGHEPAYPTGRHIGDSLDQDATNRDKYVNMLTSYGVSTHVVGHTHVSSLVEMVYDNDLNASTTLQGGMWEIDLGAFGTKASGGSNDSYPSLGYFHANSAVWGDYELRLVQGQGSPDWASPVVATSTHADLTRQVLVNTWTGAGTGTTTSGHFDMKYWPDYDSSVEANPDWSSNNSGRWWEPDFDADAAGWNDGELAVGYDDNAAAWGWLNHQFDPDPNASGSNTTYGYFGRVTFQATSTDNFGFLDLEMDWEDAIIVWLNGTEVYTSTTTEITVPSTGSGSEYFDKCTTDDAHNNNLGKEATAPVFTTYDISSDISALVDGTNTLAYMIMNSGVDCDDAKASSDLAAGIRLSMYGEVQPPAVDLDQIHYRWRNDDDNEADATWMLAEDTASTSVLLGTKKRLRVEVSNEGTASSSAGQYTLQWSTSSSPGSGTWTNIAPYASSSCDSSAPLCMELSNLINASATTNVASGLSDAETTFVPGEQLETQATTSSSIALAIDEFTEIEWVVKVMGHAATNTNYYFKVVRDGADLDTYSVMPNLKTTQSGSGTGATTTEIFRDGVDSYSGTTDHEIRSTGSPAGDPLLADGDNPDAGILIKWDLSSIPSSATVSAVDFTYNIANISNSSYNIYELLRDWDTSANWTTYDGSNTWTTTGGDGAGTDRESTVLGTVSESSLGIATSSLNASGVATVQDWVDGTASNYGFIISNYDGATDGQQLNSSENGTVGNRPKLTVTYVDDTTDTTLPQITDVSTNKADGTYGIGEVIDIDITYSEPVTSSGTVTVTLETGTTDRTCTITATNTAFMTCNYTVQAGDNVADLTVNSIVGTMLDAAGNAATGTAPIYDNLADFHDITIESTTSEFDQGNWRTYINDSGQEPDDPLAAENATGTLLADGDPFRIRMLIGISSTTLATSGANFKLQYVDPGTGSCAAPTGGTPATYTDVTATTGIAYYDNAGADDGDTADVDTHDPTGPGSVILQTYEEANNFTNSVASVGVGDSALWDFALVDNSTPAGTTYCFRIVNAGGSLLDSYSSYPKIKTYDTPYVSTGGSYRLFEEVNSTDVGTPLAAQNATGTLEYEGQAFRLRQLVNVFDSPMPTSSGVFRLQFVDPGTGTCAAPSGGSPSSYTNVTDSTFIAFNTAASSSNGDPLTDNANDPDDTNFVRNQTWNKANPATNTISSIPSGFDGLWDFALKDNGAATSTTYCLRMAGPDGFDLDGGYNQYAQITTADPIQFHQQNYRLYRSAGETNPTSTLAAQNTTSSLGYAGQEFRFRQLIQFGSTSAATGTKTFKAQFVDKGTGTCAAPSGGSPSSYTDITDATFIKFASGTDGITIGSALGGDPTPGAGSTVYQTLERANPATNSVAFVPADDFGLWDFVLEDNTGGTENNYCFRIVEGDGTVFTSYLQYPEVGTVFNTDWWNTSWENRKQITFSNASQTEDLVDFPVMIQIGPGTVSYNNFTASGSDIRFIDADQSTILSYEVEQWSTTSTSTFWVKVPQINGSSDSDRIWLYYNNPSASTNTAVASDVWDSNYIMVHHFGETSGNYLDSTSNNHDSTAVNVISRASSSGSIGPAPDFDGGDGTDYIAIPDSNDFDTSNHTIEAYVNSDGAGTTISSGGGGTTLYPIVDKGVGESESAAADVQYFFGYNTSNQIASDYEATDSANNPVTGSTALTSNGSTWYHVVSRMNVSTDNFNVFVNGAINGTTTRTDTPNTGGTMQLTIGAGAPTSNTEEGGFNGRIDEVRISDIARSDDWIAASAQSMTWGTFASCSAPESNASIQNANVEPQSLLPGASGSVDVTFTTTNTVLSNGKIYVSFPTDLGNGFTLGDGGPVTVNSISGFDGTLTVSTTSTTTILTRSGGSSSGAGVKSFTLTNIKNPTSTGSTGQYTIRTTNAADETIDENTNVAADTIAGGSLTDTNVQPTSLEESATTTVTVSFTNENIIPDDGQIVVTFPTSLAGGFTFATPSAITVSTSTNIDGTLSVSTSSNVVTVTRSGGSTVATGTAVSFTLTNIQNPTSSGSTGLYQIKTTQSDGTTIDEDTAVTADVITGTYPLGDELIYYTFESGSSTVINYGTGGATYNSSYTGAAATTTTSKFGSYGATFGETGDYIDTFYGTGFDPSVNSMSFQFWLYKNEASNGCNSSDDDHFFGASGATANTRMYLRCKADAWQWRLGGDAEVPTGVSNDHQTFEHIVFILDADTDVASWYHNGTLVATSSIPSYTLGRDFWIGNMNDGTTAEGGNVTVDDFALWDRALSSEEVTTLYNAGLRADPPGGLTAVALNSAVALYWNDASGTSTSDYVIEYKLNASSTWTTFSDGISTATNTTVTGLTNDVAYNFRVSTVNQYGTGNPTSPVTATPTVNVNWQTPPTIGEGLSTTTTTIYSWATTTFPAVSFNFRLENDLGGLIEYATSSLVYGPLDITKLTNQVDAQDLAIDSDTSGVTYASTTDTIWVIHNSDGDIDELTTDGTFIRKITCTTCGDTEGIEFIGSVPDGSGDYIHTFMVSTEGEATFFEIEISSTTTAVDNTTVYNLGLGNQANLGIEGLAYSFDRDVYYAIKEKTPMALYEVDISGATSTTEICDLPTLFSGIATDVSDIDYKDDSQHAYVLSHESDVIIEVDLTSTSSCSVVATTTAGMTQGEGIGWDYTGEYLYVVGEPDELSVWRTTEFHARYTYSGLSGDEYNMYIGAVDQFGNVSTTSARNFTINAGNLSVDIVTSTGTPVTTPSVAFNTVTFSFDDQVATSTLGVTEERIRVENGTGDSAWTMSIAASSTTALWEYGATSTYDFNDATANAEDGGDGDSVGGQITIDASEASLDPEGGCGTTGLSLGSSNAFEEGVTDSITLLSANGSADTGCYWDLTDVSVSETIPGEQPAGDYTIDMTLSIIAS